MSAEAAVRQAVLALDRRQETKLGHYPLIPEGARGGALSIRKLCDAQIIAARKQISAGRAAAEVAAKWG